MTQPPATDTQHDPSLPAHAGPVRVLILEDISTDAELMEHELRKAGLTFTPMGVTTREAFLRALEEFKPDVILADYKLPDFSGTDALKIVRRDHPEIPVIMITGVLPDVEAVEFIHQGAKDYVLKDRMARLGSAVQRALSAEHGIRARKAAEKAVRESEEKFRQICATAQDAILMMDSTGLVSYWNRAAEEMFDYAEAEVLGKALHTLIVPERFRQAFMDKFPAFVATGEGAVVGKTVELAAFGKNGEEFPVELSISAVMLDEKWCAVGFIRDITGRKEFEKALADELNAMTVLSLSFTGESDFQVILDEIVETAILLAHADKGTIQLLDPLTGRLQIHSHRGFRQPWLDFWNQVEEGRGSCGTAMQRGERVIVEDITQSPIFVGTPSLDIQLAEDVRAVVSTPLNGSNGQLLGMFSVHFSAPTEPDKRVLQRLDLLARISSGMIEHKQIESELQKSEERNRQLFESSRDALMTLAPPSWKFTRANLATVKLFGASSAAEFTTLGPWEVSPESQPDGRLSGEKAQEMIARAMEEGANFFEWEHQRLNGECFSADVLLTRITVGKEVFLQATVRDITERKRVETHIQKLTRLYATLSHTNTTIVHAANRENLFCDICRGVVEHGKFVLAWVGLADEATHRVRPVCHYGAEQGYLENIFISIDDIPQGRGPTGTAIRENRVWYINDFASDERALPWREEALERGYRSAVGLPLRLKGKVIGALTMYSDEPGFFDTEQLDLMEEMSSDISFALDGFEQEIQRRRAEAERETALSKLKKALGDSIRVATSISEMRDPYTAGHQQRVSQLAAAIAVEMGFNETRIEGIRFGSLIHDVGKIGIPAEILSKPSKLIPLEMELIRTHPQAGYEIIRDIEFPWPVAQMILQHHERLDGSGYPSGLKDDAILLEARIIAVADTIEAMSSHRPYRPGLGMEAALAEIIAGSGVRYDKQVVDACLRLIREKGFTFTTG